MDSRQLLYFLAVAEERNFTRAAARCHIVQSALSYQISRLEREQGVSLFERTSRSVTLTAAADVLVPHARRALAEIETAAAELAALSGLFRGRLRLGLVGSAGSLPAVESALAAFHRRHPGVDISIRDEGSRRMAAQVRESELDLAFVGLHPEQLPHGLAHRVLIDEPLVAIVPTDHRLSKRADGSPVELAELAEGNAFVDLRPESGLRLQVDAAFHRAGVHRRTAFELATSDAVLRLVALGLGVALVPRSTTRAAGVGVLALDDPLSRHPITMVYREPAPAAPAAREFLRMLGVTAGG